MAKTKPPARPALTERWKLSPAATLGSALRAKGILQELRARLPVSARSALDISGTVLTLSMAEEDKEAFAQAVACLTLQLETIESLPILPREIEEILAITTSERRRWLEDGRLPSAGTRTITLRGRARRITFYVFDPRLVEDLANRGAADDWREDDALAKAEKRAQALHHRRLAKASKAASRPKPRKGGADAPELAGWDAFFRDGLLR